MSASVYPPCMPIEHIPDYDKRLDRQDAFWDGAILDRPVVVMSLHRPNPDFPPPPAHTYATPRDRWLDVQGAAGRALHHVMNTEYLGDALPSVFPNLGPEVFSAWFDMELEYGDATSWSKPNLHDWADAPRIRFNRENFFWKKTIEMTDALIEAGRGKFYTGYTDLHPGGDALAAFRDPLNLNIDMIENPEAVRDLRAYVDDVFVEIFDFFGDRLQQAGQAITGWPGIVSRRRWHVPSNDFSCMISKDMFDEIFLPGIVRECRHAQASIYHLDGPDALRHLDSLLEIKELNAIQWIYGAGHGRATDWLPVYKKCQTAGKGLQLGADPDELDTLMTELRPEGIYLSVNVNNREQAAEVLRRVARWT